MNSDVVMTSCVSIAGRFVARRSWREAFTLIELLVVLGIMALLMGILVPAVGRIKQYARNVVNINNQRQIVAGATEYSLHNDEGYPPSIAKVIKGSTFGWDEPRTMTACLPLDKSGRRSISSYLYPFLENAKTMYCPSAPNKYGFQQEAWDDGDQWDHPTALPSRPIDPVYGTYCFYWNYIGYLPATGRPFAGPRNSAGGYTQTTVLISDYFGYGHPLNLVAYNNDWRAYGSCEMLDKGAVTPGSPSSADFWSIHDKKRDLTPDMISVKLHAGYVDGHVATYTPAEAVQMKVSKTADGMTPHQTGQGPGSFFLPPNVLR